MAIGKLVSLAVRGASTLGLEWDDGHSAQIDLGEVIASHPGLKPIRSAKMFAKAAIAKDGWSVEWPGDIDFGSPQLRRWADEQAGETMRAGDFRKWMEAHDLTMDSAASTLGLSRRMIAYYLSGEKPIPKTVLLATFGSKLLWGMEKTVKPARGVAESEARFAAGAKGNRIKRDATTGELVSVQGAKRRRTAIIVEQLPKSGRSSRKTK